MAAEILTLEIDCHAHDWDGTDGYLTLVGIAETYGILIYDMPDHPLAGWATWYRITGPLAHLRRFLIEEYCGDAALADEILAATIVSA